MSNPSKAKGTRFETALVRWLQARTGDERIHRKALHGSADEGDIGGLYAHGLIGIIESKNYAKATKADMDAFKAQTLAERDNADAGFGVLVVNRPGCGTDASSPRFSQHRALMTVRDLNRLSFGIDHPDNDAWWVEFDLDALVWLLTEGPRHGQ